MIYNKYMLSTLRELRARDKEGKNAMTMLFRLLNEYHSIDLRYGDADTKTETKRQFVEAIKQVASDVSPSIRSKVNGWIKNKSSWESDREKFS